MLSPIKSSQTLKMAVLAVVFLGFINGWSQTEFSINTEKSSFTYYMKHPLHSWSATSRDARGYILAAPDWKSADIQVKIPVLSFDSHNRNRDSHMGEVIESYIFHDVTFRGKVVELDSMKSDDTQKQFLWKIAGQLTFHGVTRSIQVPVKTVVRNHQIQASGEFNLKLTDYDIKLPSFLSMKVKDNLRMVFNIIADQKSQKVARVNPQSAR